MSSARFTNARATSKHGGYQFEVYDVDLSYVNALRRCLLSLVPTAAFDFNPVEGAGVRVISNTTVLNNEFIGHRISLIPICLTPTQLRNFDPRNYKCVIRKKNTGESLEFVTSKDIDVYDMNEARYTDGERDALFPACPYTGDNILITPIKPNTVCDGSGEELHAECTARIGAGREHSRFSPVSTCYFTMVVDEAAAGAARGALESESAKKTFDTLERNRYYVKNEYGEPSAYDFSLECVNPNMPPQYLVFLGMHTICKLVMDLTSTLMRVNDQSEDSSITFAIDLPKHEVDMTIRDADHTLGNLLQGLLYIKWIREDGKKTVSFVGYHQPHPLEDAVTVKVQFTNPISNDVAKMAQFMSTEISWVLEHTESIMKEWVKETQLESPQFSLVLDTLSSIERRKSSNSTS